MEPPEKSRGAAWFTHCAPFSFSGPGTETREVCESQLSLYFGGKIMCQYSAYAEWTRDARQGEDLVVSNAPHASSHWLTEPGKPHIAVCIPNQAPLAVQVAGSTEIRGANFEHQGWVDFLGFIDRDRERVALNHVPCESKTRGLASTAG